MTEWSFTFFTYDKKFLECGGDEQVILANGKTEEDAFLKAVKDLPSTGVWELAEPLYLCPSNQQFTTWTP